MVALSAQVVESMARFLVLEVDADDLAAKVSASGQQVVVAAGVDAASAVLGEADIAGLVLGPGVTPAERRALEERLASLGALAPSLVVVGNAGSAELSSGLAGWSVRRDDDDELLAAVLAGCRERCLRLRAEAASRTTSGLLADACHETRTPLGTILGFIELLKAPDVAAEDRLIYLETVERNGSELRLLLDGFRDLLKLEAGRLAVEQLPFDLSSLLADVVSSLSARASAKGLGLTIASDGPLPALVCSDPTRLEQILVDLVGNAIKLATQGNVELRVKKLPGERLVFVVKDSGGDIARSGWCEHFQPVARGDPSATLRNGGVGLRLELSRRLARLLGGDLAIENSELGIRGCFVLTITQGSFESDGDAALAAQDDAAAAPARDAERPLAGLRVLVAEDAPDNRYLLERLLTGGGAGVVLVENGALAVERAMAANFDVILMDIQMPVVDGYEATRDLRRRGYSRPIVALTAHAMREERERCLAAGCDDHLTKPLAAGLLMETIMRLTRGVPTPQA